MRRLPIDLDLQPSERWSVIGELRAEAQELTDSYVKDLGGDGALQALLPEYRRAFVSAEHAAEVDAIAALIGRTPEDVLLANLYYDAMHALLGCTAFAVETEDGPLHARNLDWWTERSILSKHTVVFECGGSSIPGPYETVGWPGFVGVFSGVAEGRFALTLNAAISNDKPALAQSVTLLLREVFDTAKGFEAALELLSETPIAADCLLLLTGVRPGEMVVIERTCTRVDVRTAENGFLAVTNDYRALDSGFAPVGGGELQATSCGRFDRATYLALSELPSTADACFRILADPRIKMGITVQHMVMRAATGELEVRLPG